MGGELPAPPPPPPPPQDQATADFFAGINPQKLFSGEVMDPAAEAAREAERQRVAAEAAKEAQVNATNDRYGTDLSWLDPSLRYEAERLGTSKGSTAGADPAAIAALRPELER